MELVTVLRLLARHPLALAAGLLVAVLAGAVAAGLVPAGPALTETTYSGFAEAKVLVDTRKSYTNDLEGGAEDLQTQAMLLASMTADDARTRALAREAGVPWERLQVTIGTINVPKLPTRLSRTITDSVTPNAPYQVRVRPDTMVSVVTIDAAAPTAREAAGLARAAAGTLEAVAADTAPSAERGLVVKTLGPVRWVTVPEKGVPAAVLGPGAALFVYAAWCCAIVLLTGLGRAWRRTSAAVPAR